MKTKNSLGREKIEDQVFKILWKGNSPMEYFPSLWAGYFPPFFVGLWGPQVLGACQTEDYDYYADAVGLWAIEGLGGKILGWAFKTISDFMPLSL